ncbi:MAG: hypothetical protein K2X27_02855 [Candidatus Obscuribacterales bacterium]|nr:hypothetical protein [Candidatus Obscuribacterales bacterium]
MNRVTCSILLSLAVLTQPVLALEKKAPESKAAAPKRIATPGFQPAAEYIEMIQRTNDDKESIQVAVIPLMESTAKRIKEGAKDFRLHLILSAAYEKMGMEELAQSEAEIARSYGEECFKFAQEAFKKKVLSSDFELAMYYYPFVKSEFPDDASLAIVDSLILHKQGKQAEAEALLNSLKNSKDFGIATAIGSLKLEKGQYEKAIALFDKDLSIDPHYDPAIVGKAKALEDLGHYGESLAVILPVYLENMNRNEVAGIAARNYCRLGYFRLALYPALVSMAVARRDEQMQQAKRLVSLLWPKLRKAERQKVLQEVSQVLKLGFFGVRMHFALADVLQKSGFIDEAEQEYRAGLKGDPRHSKAYLHLGEIYQNNYHNGPGAIFNYVKYLHFGGRDPYIEQRVARLLDEDKRYKDIALRIKRKLHPLKNPGLNSNTAEPETKKNEQAS